LPVAQRQSTGKLKRQTGRLTFKPDHPDKTHPLKDEPHEG
jgi:hypothetical protein